MNTAHFMLAFLAAAANTIPHSSMSKVEASAEDYCLAGQGKIWIWISKGQIKNIAMTGAEWDARPTQNRGVYYYAQQSTANPMIANNDDNTDVYALAKALVWLRMKQIDNPTPQQITEMEGYRAAVQTACLAARETENGGTTLELGRNLFGYVAAANIIDWDNSVPGQRQSDFRTWVDAVRTEVFQDGPTLFRTLIQAHETRPNNWGLMCGTSRLAASIYLCDIGDENACWDVFSRWLGDPTSTFNFQIGDWGGGAGDLSWQQSASNPVGINPLGSGKLDCQNVFRSLDGVMPDDMRRAGSFDSTAPCVSGWSWPPYTTNPDRDYNWEAMQAVLAQAVMHKRRGRDPASVSNDAVKRAFQWLYTELQFPVTHIDAGDDGFWMPYIANRLYPTLGIVEPVGTKPGKQTGYADWTTLNPNWP